MSKGAGKTGSRGGGGGGAAIGKAPAVDVGAKNDLIAQYKADGIDRVYRLVPISSISQPNTYMSPADYRQFASLKKGSPMPPVELERSSNGKLSINDGAHRVKAAQKLGFTHVPAILPP